MNGQIKRIYNQHWLELPKEIRDHLVKKLGLVRTGITEVRDQTVLSDGHTNDDLAVITSEKLSEYVGSPMTDKVDFPHLWSVAVSKANFELHPPININELKNSPFAPALKEPLDALINKVTNTNNAKIENKENSKEEGNLPTSNTTGTLGTTQISTESKSSEGSGSSTLPVAGEGR